MTTLKFTTEEGKDILVYCDEQLEILKDFKKGEFFAVDGLSGNRIIGIANGSFNADGLPTLCWVDGDKLVFAEGMAFTNKGRVSVTDAKAEEITHLLTMLKANGYELVNGGLVKVKWRAKVFGVYLFVNAFGEVLIANDNMNSDDNKRHAFGNYFNPDTEAKLAEEIANKQKQLYKR